MSDTMNPPLEPGRVDAGPPAYEHASGPIVNPPLEGSRSTASAAADLQNPPLDSGSGMSAGRAPTTDNPSLDSLASSRATDGLNPPLDDTDIERWFERQIEQSRGAAPPEMPVAKKEPAKRPPVRKRAAKKRAAKSVAKKRSSPTKSVKKKN